MQIWNEDGQASLFAPDGCAGRTCPARSAQGTPRGRISASSWRRSSELKAIPFMSLDLTPGHGNLLGESYWEMTSPLLGGSSMLNTGPAPLSAEDVFSLSQILQDDPPRKYYLSRTACLGILRRARERGKELPPQLKTALMAQAGLIPVAAPADELFIDQDCLTPWDTQQARIFTPESKAPTLASADGGGGRNPGGLLFAAGFCAGAGPSAGGIGYQEECAPTLKASESGTNMVPSVLCLNDQGGGVMACSEDVAGTLRAQEHGHQPLVFDNHGQDTRFQGPVDIAQTVSASFGQGGNNQPLVMGTQQGGAEIMVGICPTITAAAGMSRNNQPVLFENHGKDARYTGPHPVSPTLSARAGTGGNNLPLALHLPEPICISGNAIDRQPQNGGNGLGCQEGIAYTLTATDHHAVFSRQRVDVFKDDDTASTQSVHQHKDATDLVLQETGTDRPLLIRRLTPLECERLQGFPDFWTDLPGASDSSRYKALGNSVAIPCVEYIMRGIAMAAGSIGDSTSSLSHGH